MVLYKMKVASWNRFRKGCYTYPLGGKALGDPRLISLLSFGIHAPETMCGFHFRSVLLELVNGHTIDFVFPKSRFEMNIAMVCMVVNA